jgi:hypothetical protein
MSCLFCRRKIGPLRRFVDSNFCCAEHRNKYRANSARALREAEDLYGNEDELGERWRLYASKEAEKPASHPSQSSAFVVAIAVAFLLFAITRGSSDNAAANPHSETDPAFARQSGGLQRRIGEAIEKRAPVTIRENFSSGFSKWDLPSETKSGLAQAGDWSVNGGYVRPGKLRVWKDSESLSNYDLEFVGHVEKKSMDWAFRAADFKNYYATKLTVTSASKTNPLPTTGMVRYAVIDGKERDRVEVPLPITLERNTDYRVKVSVRGGRFLTSINGQLVSSWSDGRISRGGVGLFSDPGESSAYKWLSVSERDSFWGRVVSHFSIIAFPSFPQQPVLAR